MCRHYQRASWGLLVLGGLGAATVAGPHTHITRADNIIITATAVALTGGMMFLIVVLSLHFGFGRTTHKQTHPQHQERGHETPSPEPDYADVVPMWPDKPLRARSEGTIPGHEDPGEDVDTHLSRMGGES